MDKYELMQIRLYRQHITNHADRMTIAKDLCGIQAQILSNAYHSIKIRSSEPLSKDTWGEGLVKSWTIRGTVHVFAQDDLPLFVRCNHGKDYHKNEWQGLRFWNQRDVWALTPQRQQFFANLILKCLAIRPHTRDELKVICQSHGMTKEEQESMFMAWGGGMRELCERGFIHYTVQEKKTFALSPNFVPMSEYEANKEILCRYLSHMAPATIYDVAYYFRYSQRNIKSYLSSLPVHSVSIAGREYFYMGELNCNYPPIPKCVFLAGFDQMMLAYEKTKNFCLPQEYLRNIFNLASIVMPSLLIDGQVRGRWKWTHGKLNIVPFKPFSEQDKHSIREAAENLWQEELKSIFYEG